MGVDGHIVLSVFDARIATLAVRTLALKDIGAIGTIPVTALQATNFVRDLAVIGAWRTAVTKVLLLIAIDVAHLGSRSRPRFESCCYGRCISLQYLNYRAGRLNRILQHTELVLPSAKYCVSNGIEKSKLIRVQYQKERYMRRKEYFELRSIGMHTQFLESLSDIDGTPDPRKMLVDQERFTRLPE